MRFLKSQSFLCILESNQQTYFYRKKVGRHGILLNVAGDDHDWLFVER